MPIGGKLLLKGGVGLSGGAVKKQKKHKSKALQPAEAGDEQQQAGAPDAAGASEPKRVAATAINVMSGKSYEQEFELEQERIKKPKVKSTPWGSTYRAAPEILHGYSSKVTGKSASERLDMRAATKSDKFAK